MQPTVGRAGNPCAGTIGQMNRDTVRPSVRPNRRILVGLFAVALLVGACGNGGTPNYGGGGGGNGAASPLETAAPAPPKNLQKVRSPVGTFARLLSGAAQNETMVAPSP